MSAVGLRDPPLPMRKHAQRGVVTSPGVTQPAVPRTWSRKKLVIRKELRVRVEVRVIVKAMANVPSPFLPGQITDLPDRSE